jgi:hypothetical protein
VKKKILLLTHTCDFVRCVCGSVCFVRCVNCVACCCVFVS